MPKVVKQFTIHILNEEASIDELSKYLTEKFGEQWNESRSVKNWYLGRNYHRPIDESVIEITFYGPPNKKHTLMAFEHPFKVIEEIADERYEPTNYFNQLFEETA
jgi:hypothetical protein